MRYFLSFIILVIQSFLFVQTGDFILSHHIPNHSGGSTINFQITADNNGIISLANRFGLLKYDGKEWDFYATNSTILSLAIDNSNRTFLGGIGEFGHMVLWNNSYHYEALLKDDSVHDHFIQTLTHNESVFFLSNYNLYSYRPDTKETEHMASGDFLNAYVFDGQLFVNTEEATFKVDGKKLTLQKDTENQWVIIMSSASNSHTYGLDIEGRLFKFVDDKPILLKHNKQLQDAGIDISNFSWVNDSLLACATTNAGVLFFNANNPKYLKFINYYSGLPDNEISDVFTDRHGGTWVIHPSGITRIAPLFPALNYSNFGGLDGNLIEARRINKELWVNTSLGVFHFKQDTSFRSKISVRPVPQKPTEKRIATKRKRKKGFISGLFNKKNPVQVEETQEKTGGFFKRVFKSKKADDLYQRHIEKIITGVSYEFVKVPNTDEKFNQLIVFQDQVLSTSHSGIYSIRKESADLVIRENVRMAYVIPDTNYLLVTTEDGSLITYAFANEIWEQISSQEMDDVILNMYSDQQGRLWLAGTSNIYQLEKDSLGYSIKSQIEINNRFFDELSFWESEGTLYLVNSEGIFELDEKNQSIRENKKLSEEIGKPRLHIQDERQVWVFNGKVWYLLTSNGSVEKHQYMGVFPSLKGITSDQKTFWLITSDNRLISFIPKNASLFQTPYDVFIKRLAGTNGALGLQDEFLFEHDQNYLSIQFLKPDYVGVLNPEYQYLLKGLHSEWSSWTHAGTIDYSFIPPGSYELLVRVRDTFGESREESMLLFKVKEPYWKQSWFYLMQVLVFSLIIGITSKLNQDNPRNRILKSALSILTLVVIIEFLQSIMSSYIGIQSTPVVDFLIDVSTAILVFPLEWILRKLILEGGMSILKKGQIKI